MSTTTVAKTPVPNGIQPEVFARILQEGYGPGAWHGSDLKASVSDVSDEAAFWRASRDRRNIAEIALHHAYCLWSARGRLSGRAPEAFVLEGEDWFALEVPGPLGWARVKDVLEIEFAKLAALVRDIGTKKLKSPLSEAERFELVLGLSCHAVYHAGQIQLIKKLDEA